MPVDCEVTQKSGISPENRVMSPEILPCSTVLNNIVLVSSVLFVSSHRDLKNEIQQKPASLKDLHFHKFV